MTGYELGVSLAIKQAGLWGNALNLAGDVGRGGLSLLKSTNPWVKNMVVGGLGTAGFSALAAPEGQKREMFLKNLVPGAVAGAAYHGVSKGVEGLLGQQMLNTAEGRIPIGQVAKPTIGQYLKTFGHDVRSLSGMNPHLSSGEATKNLVRTLAPGPAALIGSTAISKALGQLPQMPRMQQPEYPQYEESAMRTPLAY